MALINYNVTRRESCKNVLEICSVFFLIGPLEKSPSIISILRTVLCSVGNTNLRHNCTCTVSKTSDFHGRHGHGNIRCNFSPVQSPSFISYTPSPPSSRAKLQRWRMFSTSSNFLILRIPFLNHQRERHRRRYGRHPLPCRLVGRSVGQTVSDVVSQAVMQLLLRNDCVPCFSFFFFIFFRAKSLAAIGR